MRGGISAWMSVSGVVAHASEYACCQGWTIPHFLRTIGGSLQILGISSHQSSLSIFLEVSLMVPYLLQGLENEGEHA
jgi:hypothetical protein